MTQDLDDLGPIKRKLGVPERLESCHTAVVEQYVIEGHVPADVIDRLLRERPAVAGLAVAGMPGLVTAPTTVDTQPSTTPLPAATDQPPDSQPAAQPVDQSRPNDNTGGRGGSGGNGRMTA